MNSSDPQIKHIRPLYHLPELRGRQDSPDFQDNFWFAKNLYPFWPWAILGKLLNRKGAKIAKGFFVGMF